MPAQYQDPSRVIARALLEARRRGLDHVSQARWAAAEVRTVRPDLSAADIARSVETAVNAMPV